MEAHSPVQPERTAPAPDLAELLWRRYRALVDGELIHGKELGVDCCRNEVRGAMYLFAVDLVARVVDRVEQESNPNRRRALIETLLAGGRPPADQGPIDGHGTETQRFEPSARSCK